MSYRGKLREQLRARELRAEARTLQEIAAEMGVSKASVSVWVRDVEFTPRPRAKARLRGPNKLQRQKQAQIEEGIEWGRRRIGEVSDRDLLIAGAMLYAGEGNKGDGSVGLANTDARMVSFFCAWLRRFFDVDESRLRVTIYLHQGLNLDDAIRHWSSVTGIPPAQFCKPYRATPDGGIRNSKHVYGCATVRYSCSATHRRVMGLVSALLECADIPG